MDSPPHQGLPITQDRTDSARPNTTVKYTVKSRNLSRSDASRCIPPGFFTCRTLCLLYSFPATGTAHAGLGSRCQTPGRPEIVSRAEEPGPSSRLALPPGSSRVCDCTNNHPLDNADGSPPAFIHAAHDRKISSESLLSGPSRQQQGVLFVPETTGPPPAPWFSRAIPRCWARRGDRIGFAPALAPGGWP